MDLLRSKVLVFLKLNEMDLLKK